MGSVELARKQLVHRISLKDNRGNTLIAFLLPRRSIWRRSVEPTVFRRTRPLCGHTHIGVAQTTRQRDSHNLAPGSLIT